MRPDEFAPTHGAPTIWRGSNTVAFQEICHSLVADLVAEISQRTDNSPKSPRAILLRHLQDEVFDLIIGRAAFRSVTVVWNRRTSWRPPAVPPKDRFWSDNLRHFFQGFFARVFSRPTPTDAFGSVSRIRPWICWRRIRFSVTR
jgi:hypothetical protein